MADLQGWSRGTWGEGDWGEFIPVQVTGVSARTAISNVVDGLTVDQAITAKTAYGDTTEQRQASVTFQTDSTGILLKSSYSAPEVWWEKGATISGAYLGIAKITDSYYIRFRTGSGSTGAQEQSDSAQFAVVNLAITDPSVSNFFDDQRHVITWSIDVDNNRLYVWIDNVQVINYDAGANGGNVISSGIWAGGDSGGYGQGFGSNVAGGTSTYDSGTTQYGTMDANPQITDNSVLNIYYGELPQTQNYPVETNADALVLPTGVSSGAVLGTAIGEAESIYPLTGVQSNTATGTLEAQEGHGVQPTGVEMQFADGTEEIIATVDAGWGRNTWGSFAWGENITIFANLVGQELSTNIGAPTIITGTGETAEPTTVLATTATGTLAMTGDALVTPTGVSSTVVIQNPTIIADGNVTTSAPGDQMDFAIGAVNIDIFTQVDATAVTSTFDTGTLAMTGDSNLTLTGEEIVSNTGTVVITAASDVPVTGEQIDTETGVIATQTDNIIPVTGFGLQIQDGAPTIVANATVLPTGVSMQFADGTASGIGSAVVTPTGVEMSVVVGNMRSTPWANVVTGASNTWTPVAA